MNTKLPIRAGVFDSPAQADHAVDDLLAAGFDRESIRVVSKTQDGEPSANSKVDSVWSSGAHTRRGVAAGVTIGALLAAFTVVVWIAPSQGEGLIVAGALLAAAVGGGLAGGFIGAMMTRGFEPAIADFHDQALSPSDHLVAVMEGDTGPSLTSASISLEHSGATALSMRRD